MPCRQRDWWFAFSRECSAKKAERPVNIEKPWLAEIRSWRRPRARGAGCDWLLAHDIGANAPERLFVGFCVLVSAVRGVYPQTEMRLKLLISLLVITLWGANTVAMAMCASYCASSKSAKTVAAHHHHNGTQANNQNSHVHGHGMRCPECPSTSGMSLNSSCGKLVQDQAIKESSASRDKFRGSALSCVATPSTNVAKPSDNAERQLWLGPSGSAKSSSRSAPLRI